MSASWLLLLDGGLLAWFFMSHSGSLGWMVSEVGFLRARKALRWTSTFGKSVRITEKSIFGNYVRHCEEICAMNRNVIVSLE